MLRSHLTPLRVAHTAESYNLGIQSQDGDLQAAPETGRKISFRGARRASGKESRDSRRRTAVSVEDMKPEDEASRKGSTSVTPFPRTGAQVQTQRGIATPALKKKRDSSIRRRSFAVDALPATTSGSERRKPSLKKQESTVASNTPVTYDEQVLRATDGVKQHLKEGTPIEIQVRARLHTSTPEKFVAFGGESQAAELWQYDMIDDSLRNASLARQRSHESAADEESEESDSTTRQDKPVLCADNFHISQHKHTQPFSHTVNRCAVPASPLLLS